MHTITILSRSSETRGGTEYLTLRVSMPPQYTADRPLRVHVPIEAISNRMKFYGLETEAEALDAILREHYYRERGKDQCPPKPWQELEPSERGRITGGLDRTVTILRQDKQ